MNLDKPIIEGFERLIASWYLLRQDIALHVRGEFQGSGAEKETENALSDEQMLDDSSGSQTGGQPETLNFDVQRYVQNRMADQVEEELRNAREHLTEREQSNFEQMVYGFVSLVDELLLISVKWHQSDDEHRRLSRRWLDFLLEKRVFGTRNAGVTLFEKISLVTQKKSLTELDKELCAVYLHILWIGFGQSKLSKQIKLGFYRRQLLSCISDWSVDVRRAIFDDQPYLVQFSKDDESKRLAPISRWRRRAIYFLVGYVVVTGVAAFYLYNWLMTSLGLMR